MRFGSLSFLFFLSFSRAQDRPEFRLPLDVEPVHYKIDLKAFLDPNDQVSYLTIDFEIIWKQPFEFDKM